MKMTSSSRIPPLVLIMTATFGWIVHIENVHCIESLGTSYQQNHPNHVLSTMGLRKPSETMEPSLATPQTGKPWKLFFFLPFSLILLEPATLGSGWPVKK